MDKKLEKLLKGLQYEIAASDYYFYEQLEVLETIFSPTKEKMKIVLISQSILPVRIIDNLNQKFKNNDLMNLKLVIKVKSPIIDTEILVEYIDFIKKRKSQLAGSGSWKFINSDVIEFDGENETININVESESQKKSMLKDFEYCLTKLNQYGFPILETKINVVEQAEDIFLKNEQSYQRATNDTVIRFSQQTQNSNKFEKPTNQSQSFSNYKRSTVNMETPSYESLLDLEDNAQNIIIHAMLIKKDIKVSKSGRNIYSLVVTDQKSSIKAVYFSKGESSNAFDNLTEDELSSDVVTTLKEAKINLGDWISLRGKTNYSDFDKEQVFYIDNFQKIEKKMTKRSDVESVKRVELHTHSKMSAMDGISDVKEYLTQADKWGWKALALTDHTNVQAFPDAYGQLKQINKNRKSDDQLKLIYGLEVTMLPNELWYVKNPKHQKLKDAKFVVFDLETTGLSPEFDEIIEFGAVVREPNKEKRMIDILIKPQAPLKAFIKDLTHITDEMLADKPTIETAFKEIYELIDGAILVAHNANFDMNFLQSYAKKLGYPPLENTVIDTLTIARAAYPKYKNHRLGTIATKNGFQYDENTAHRGDYDADVLISIYERFYNDLKNKFQIDYDDDWNKVHLKNDKENLNYLRNRGYHTTVLAKNQTGLKELYKIVSFSHTQDFFAGPKIFQNNLAKFHINNNLLFGTSCVNGEIFDLARTGTIEKMKEKMNFYDYVEVQPLSVYKNLLQNNSLDETELKRTIKIIIKTALELNKLVVASSDAHYVDPEMKLIRDIYIAAKGLGGAYHPLYDFKKRVKENPDQHLRTTKEMLNEFEWLEDEALINDLVINNPIKIADLISNDVKPIKEGSYAPYIENVDQLLRDKCYETAYKFYGSKLPTIVEQRLEKELNSIIKHGFAVIYWISHKLVERSLNDGYLVGSRGSVGSSFVATMSQITEVNPLKAHYRCSNCQYSNFETDPKYNCGYDLPKTNCPNCNQQLIGDGHDIPFETFLGFDGDKVPDIDLNFSGEYQMHAHNFTKEMFGENNVFRAGTISTVASKTAFGYVKAYYESNFDEYNQPRKVEIERLASLAEGVKRTTGQHPGGIIILPSEYEIEDFTPVNYPADDINSSWKTTHFDFHSIHDNLLKMDILGHVDPTALKMLRDITGVDPINIPTNDEQVYSLFSGLTALDISPDQINQERTGAIGIPEFGTEFVRGMLNETKPSTFADLVQISGLSHGTDVWLGNARELIKQKVANISTVIGCRDDIMVYLMNKGLESTVAFAIMESVRKGKGLTKNWISTMKEHQVPEWYIESCLKIKYMFPKAHATAYVLMAYRIAWYKINFPTEYYATFFSTRADAFDLKAWLKGYDGILEAYRAIEQRQARNDKMTKKDLDLKVVYEVQLEMFSRNIKVKNIDFNKSSGTKFLVEIDEQTKQKVIIPPFNIIDSLGEAVAQSIVSARTVKQISSVNDLKNRTQVTQTQLKIFEELNITDSLKNDEQLMFDF